MKLDKDVEPLPRRHARCNIRPRSALGLKYVELKLGTSEQTYPPGDTIPLEELDASRSSSTSSSAPSTRSTRDNQRTRARGLRHAFAGRGEAINQVIHNLVPFLTHLEPVMRTLSDPRHAARPSSVRRGAPLLRPDRAGGRHLRAAVREHGRPPSRRSSRDPEALRQTIERSPARSSGHPLVPGAAAVPGRRRDALPPARAGRRRDGTALPPRRARAARSARPVLRQGADAVRAHRGRVRALEDARREPEHAARAPGPRRRARRGGAAASSTSRRTRRSATTGTTTGAALGEHVSEPVRGGTGPARRSSARQPHAGQPPVRARRPTGRSTSRRARTRYGATDPAGDPLVALHTHAVRPGDRRGRATPTARPASAATCGPLRHRQPLRAVGRRGRGRRQPRRAPTPNIARRSGGPTDTSGLAGHRAT